MRKTLIVSITILCLILSSCTVVKETRVVCSNGSSFLYDEDCNSKPKN